MKAVAIETRVCFPFPKKWNSLSRNKSAHHYIEGFNVTLFLCDVFASWKYFRWQRTWKLCVATIHSLKAINIAESRGNICAPCQRCHQALEIFEIIQILRTGMLQTGGGFNVLTSAYLTKLFSHFISVSRATQFRKWKQHISGGPTWGGRVRK